MPAYLISDVTVKDREAYEAYRTRAAPSIAQYGGRYLARGGAIEPLEGDWTPRIIVIAEFPDLDSARGMVPLARIRGGARFSRRRLEPQSHSGRWRAAAALACSRARRRLKEPVPLHAA